MTQKNIALLTVLFVIVLLLSVSGKLNYSKSAPQNPPPSPKASADTAKPAFLPLELNKNLQTIKNFVSPSPIPSSTPSPTSQSQSLESVKELQQSLNVSLDLSSNGIPFGGKVLDVQSCDSICLSPYDMIIVGPPVGGTYLVGPTTIYREYDYSAGHWVLGLANGFGVCLVLVFDECVPIGAGPIVDIMGTSN